jgi:hypothetical protein
MAKRERDKRQRRDRDKRRPQNGNAANVAISHVGSGKYSDVFKVRGGYRTPAVIMKVSYYRTDTLCDVLKHAKKGDAAAARRAKKRDSIQVGSAFAKLTASLLDTVSPHFVYVFCDRDCTAFAQRLGPLLKNRLSQLTPHQVKYNNVCFMEVFHSNMTVHLTRAAYDEAALRGMIFQVLYTLAALQSRLPGFRHNDLSTNNVLIKKLRRAPLLSYTLDGRTFYVASKLLPALSDYDFTNVPGHPSLSNERVYSGKYKVDGRPNDSYDTHFFLKSVMKCIQRRASQYPATWAWLTRLKMKEQDRQNATVMARLRPATLLRDPYFGPLTINTTKSAPDAAYAA